MSIVTETIADSWAQNPDGVITTTTAEDFDEAQATIQLALFGDGEYKQDIARKHTIVYQMKNGKAVTEEKAKSYQNASFIVEVTHKKDNTVDIVVIVNNSVVTTTQHIIKRIF